MSERGLFSAYYATNGKRFDTLGEAIEETFLEAAGATARQEAQAQAKEARRRAAKRRRLRARYGYQRPKRKRKRRCLDRTITTSL